MATYYKRKRKTGIRWTVRVRREGREITKTFSTKGAAEAWARARETAIETGVFTPVKKNGGDLFADIVDKFLEHRRKIGRPPRRSFAQGIARLKEAHGLEPLGNLDVQYWRRHALARIRDGAKGQTAAGELIYAGSVTHWAEREGYPIDGDAPGKARTMLGEDGIRIVARTRDRRITDDEIDRLLKWFDKNAKRTSLPMRDIVEFALATAMRVDEIRALLRSNIKGRVARIRRKHPREPDRIEDVPLLKPHAVWPRVDPLEIIKRQPKGDRIFPVTYHSIRKWFDLACEGAKLDPDISFHSLRHECLSRLAERGFDPLRLALVGGHRDLRSVRRYAKLDAAKLANEQ